MNLDAIIFTASAVIAVFGALMMIFQRNPVASVLYLILSLLAQAVLYVQLGALFVGAMLVIVYAGAIMVLFLFVIMLLNLRGNEDLGTDSKPLSKLAKYTVAVLFLVELIFVIREITIESARVGVMNMQTDLFGSVREVAMLLFTKYLYPFELTGVLLLIALVGAVVIARRDKEEDERHEAEMPESTSIEPGPVENVR